MLVEVSVDGSVVVDVAVVEEDWVEVVEVVVSKVVEPELVDSDGVVGTVSEVVVITVAVVAVDVDVVVVTT